MSRYIASLNYFSEANVIFRCHDIYTDIYKGKRGWQRKRMGTAEQVTPSPPLSRPPISTHPLSPPGYDSLRWLLVCAANVGVQAATRGGSDLDLTSCEPASLWNYCNTLLL